MSFKLNLPAMSHLGAYRPPAHIFHLVARSGVVVRNVRVLESDRQRAWTKVLRMYPGSREATPSDYAEIPLSRHTDLAEPD